jgi:hypothetical protein
VAHRCLYCKTPTTGAEGKAHVLPEAVAANEFVLAPGAMCDQCNNYFSTLDTALANHPLIAFGIQAIATPGKKGKARSQVGYFGRAGGDPAANVTLSAANIHKMEIIGDTLSLGLKALTGKPRALFHRALHYVGFNYAATLLSTDTLLASPFHPVRRYIRSPSLGEVWPYCYAKVPSARFDTIELLTIDEPKTQVVLHLFNQAFAVDLLRSGTLFERLTSQAPADVLWQEYVE